MPAQTPTAQKLKAFSAQPGDLEINVAGGFQEPGIPEVTILSNVVEVSCDAIGRLANRVTRALTQPSAEARR